MFTAEDLKKNKELLKKATLMQTDHVCELMERATDNIIDDQLPTTSNTTSFLIDEVFNNVSAGMLRENPKFVVLAKSPYFYEEFLNLYINEVLPLYSINGYSVYVEEIKGTPDNTYKISLVIKDYN